MSAEGWTYADAEPESAPTPEYVVDMPHGTIPRIGPAVPPECISPDEQLYNARIAAEHQRAQGAVMASALVIQAWWEHLRDKYGLDEADTIDERGVITRNVPQDAPQATETGEAPESE